MEITIPASFYENLGVTLTQKQVDKESKEEGMKSVINEDGSVTCKMSKSVYKQKLEEYASIVHNAIDDILEDKETYPTNMDITTNEDFFEFMVKTICTSKEEFSIGESMIDLNLSISAMTDQMFLVNPPRTDVLNGNIFYIL